MPKLLTAKQKEAKKKLDAKKRAHLAKIKKKATKGKRPKEDYETGTPMFGYGKKKIKRKRAKG